MKRSEMVKIIWDFVQTVEYDYDYYMSKSDCNDLLLKIEEAGMLPPEVKDYTNSTVIELNEWEPEDEIQK